MHTYLIVTVAQVYEVDAMDILDAMLRAHHEMGSRGILAVVEKGADLPVVLLEAA